MSVQSPHIGHEAGELTTGYLISQVCQHSTKEVITIVKLEDTISSLV